MNGLTSNNNAATARGGLFEDLAAAVAAYTTRNPNVRDWIANKSVTDGKVDVTALTRISQQAEVRRQQNGNLLFSFTDRDGKVYNHSFNWNDATETKRLQSIINDGSICDNERLLKMSEFFTKMGMSVKVSSDYNQKMQNERSQSVSLGR